jgi:acetyl/propionyl-CoA carboxylase alpha subunit
VNAREARASAELWIDGERVLVWEGLSQLEIAEPQYGTGDGDAEDGDGVLRAPINGRIVRLHVAEGDVVERGASVAVVEAMKMEHIVRAPIAGRICELNCEEGAQTSEGAVIARIAPLPAAEGTT